MVTTWQKLALATTVMMLGISAAAQEPRPRVHEIAAKDTLQAARMNDGETLRFTLKNGQARTFVLQKATARIVERPLGGIVYSFDCTFLAEGQPLTLRRYVCSQETFYEPWVINGVRAAVAQLEPVGLQAGAHSLPRGSR